MLDWSRIDNDKIFQRLISHLGSLECRTPGFLPSSPYIGPDGGYDAYTTQYVDEGLSGRICIQSKYTKHSNKEAFEYLRGEVKKELDKAKRNGATHLIIATNAELSVPYVQQLQELNTDKNFELFVWPREALSVKIERQPFLRQYFFNSPSIPLFVPTTTYFETSDNDLIDSEESLSIEIGSISGRVEEFRSFIANDAQKIFVIHSPGGYGKSHFLRELARASNTYGLNREVWFIRDGVREVKEAFGDELGVREVPEVKHKYTLVLDDADRVDDIKDVLSCTMKSGIDIKLVMSLRTSGLSILKDLITGQGYRPQMVVSEIPQWTWDELKLLLRRIVGKDTVENEELIVRRYPNPFFIVKLAQFLKRTPKTDFELLRQAILQSLIRDTKRVLSSTSIDAEKLLLHLSLISPINIFDQNTILKISQKLDMSTEQLKSVLDALVESKTLRKIGSLIRFIPDMVGDVFLLEKMNSLGEEERRVCFLYWFDSHSKNIFCNLGATLKYGDDSCLKPVIEDVIANWIVNAEKYDEYQKIHILDNLQEISSVAVDRAVDLVWVFLSDPNLSTDKFGPVILSLIHSGCSREKIVRIICTLKEKAKLGMYDNYKPNSLIKSAVSPIHNQIESQVLPTLSALSESLAGDISAGETELLKAALGEILAGTHEYTESTYGGMTIGSRLLKVLPAVITMRDAAIEILKKMLVDARPSVRKEAIDVIEDIGRTHMGHSVGKIPLTERIQEEKRGFVKFVQSNGLIEKEENWGVLSAYEDWCFAWWARQEVPDEEIIGFFSKFPHDPEYRLIRYYTSRWDLRMKEGLEKKLSEAPIENRWHWAVDNLMERKWHLEVKDFVEDAKYLDTKYSSTERILSFFNQLCESVQINSANALFLRAWVAANPAIFKEIWENADAWGKVPILFKYTISYELASHFPDLAVGIINKTLFSVVYNWDEVKIALDLLTYNLPIDKLKLIKELALKGNKDLNFLIVHKLRFIGDKFSPEEMADALAVSLNGLEEKAEEALTDEIGFILHNRTPEYRERFLNLTSARLRQIILERKELSYHDREIISYLITNTKDLMDLIEARLEKEEAINSYSQYQAVAHRDQIELKKFVKTRADYLLAIERLLNWDQKYEGVGKLSVEEVFKQFLSLEDQSGELLFNQVKSGFNNKGEFKKLLTCLAMLPLIAKTQVIFQDAIKASSEFGFEDDMAVILKNRIYPEEGWNSSVGQTPPAFLEKKRIFEELKDTAPLGKLRTALDQCLDVVQKLIQEHKEDEDNYFHSR